MFANYRICMTYTLTNLKIEKMDLKQLFESNSITIDLQGQGLIEIMDYEKFNEIVRYILIDFADTIEHGMIDNMSSQDIVEHFLS